MECIVPKQMKVICVVLLGMFVLGTTGFGTILSGRYQAIQIKSEPSGAEVTAYSSNLPAKMVGRTPLTYWIRKKHALRLTFEKAGYELQEFRVGSKFNPVSLLNLCLGYVAPLGGLVDMASGGWRRVSPTEVCVALTPIGNTEASGDNGNAALSPELEPKLSVEERLKKLRTLRKQDLISEENYKATEKEILRDL